MPANLENSAVATGLEKVSFHSIPKKVSAEECSNYCTIALISHTNKVILKILQARLHEPCMNHELPDVQTGFIKGREARDQIAKSIGSLKSQRVPEKHLLLLYWLCQSLWLWITTNCGKFWKRREYQTTWPASWEICMQIKKHQLELNMEQQTVSKLGKEYVKAVYCHPAYLTSVQSTSCKMPGWMKHKVESRLSGEISITSDMQMTPPLWQKVKNQRASWWKWKRRVKKLG